ncbi:MAG: sodium:calcium antiporter [Planctomycetota bacterium]
MLLNAFYFVGGLAVLVVGAELLVRGASRLASAAGVSALVVGLTVVAFGTSAPELAVSLKASLSGQPNLALGNVVGSNIFNVLFILGLSALVAPLVVHKQLVRVDVPVMIAVTGLTWGLSLNGTLSRIEGILLSLLLLAYIGLCIHLGRKDGAANGAAEAPADPAADAKPAAPAKSSWLIDCLCILAGLGLLILGAQWLVTSATSMAKALGISDLVVALTIVAAGTSLPEVATSVMATYRGQRDIAVGNVIGSNIFNLLCILGLSCALSPQGVEVASAARNFDIPVMMAVAVACFPIFFTGHLIARWEGAVFLAYYAAYTGYLILLSTQHAALPGFSFVMLAFAAPLTTITLAVCFFRAWRARHPESV